MVMRLLRTVQAGDRFAAARAYLARSAQQVRRGTRWTGAGLTVRMDHGSRYTSDDLRNQLGFWGITASYAFVAEPQTNGVAERFNRTVAILQSMNRRYRVREA